MENLKTAETIANEFKSVIEDMDVEISEQEKERLTSFLLEETRQAWIRGKEYGWSKAWNWKRTDAKA